ncbi:MAG TPA: GNAT family N-acetyltransferase [Polyangia bacterium]|jgi:ribosomal protein S18 acetylase RimI-like enzyme
MSDATPPTPAVTIRDAAADDVAPLAARLHGLPLLARYGVTEESLARDLGLALERGDGLLCAAGPDGPVGFAWFLTAGTFASGGYLRLIAVAPGQQGGALGSRLLDEVERRVAVRSRTMFLLVSDFNTGAQRFYARRGYRDAGALEAFVRPDVDERIYWKRLR